VRIHGFRRPLPGGTSKQYSKFVEKHFDACCRRVFGNERGKVIIEDEVDEREQKWHQFIRRRAGWKAAKRAMEARLAMQRA